MTHPDRAARRQRIAAAVASGKDIGIVARNEGVTIGQAYKACQETGTPVNGHHQQRAVLRHRLASLVENGATAAEAADEEGVSRSMVYDACHEHGVRIVRAPMNRRNSIKPFEVLALLQNTKLSLAAIARDLGCSRQHVHQIAAKARAAGIKVRES